MVPRRWYPFLGLLFILGLFFKIPMLVMLPTAMAVVIFVANWWKKRALENVFYRRKFHYTRGFPGEEVDVRLEIENRKFMPLSWLRVRDPWPKAVGPVDEKVLAPSHQKTMGEMVNIFSLRWFERSQREYPLLFRKRGVYQVGPARLESGDLFGMYSESRKHGKAEYLTVFPKLIPVEKTRRSPWPCSWYWTTA